VTSLSFGILVF